MRKVMLVTGASAGIGREVAILPAREDHAVYADARRLDGVYKFLLRRMFR